MTNQRRNSARRVDSCNQRQLENFNSLIARLRREWVQLYRTSARNDVRIARQLRESAGPLVDAIDATGKGIWKKREK